MAKNKNNEFDFSTDNNDDSFLDNELGDDIDFDDLDLDEKSRDTSLIGIGKQALKDAFNPDEKLSVMKDSIKRTLPDKIKGDVEGLESLADTVSDSVNKNVELLGKDLKSLGNKVDKLLPKDGLIRDLFNKIYERDEEREAELSEAQRKEQEILQQTSDALGDIAAVTEQTSLRDNILADKRTSSTNEILKLIAKDTNATKLLGYEYSAKYYKKSLELQFRTVSILRDTLEANRVSYKEILVQLANISKNTSLPDIIKQRNTELLTAGIKGKLRDMAVDSLMGNEGLLTKIGKNISNRINNFASDAREYITSGDMILEQIGDFLGPDSMMDPKAMAAGMLADNARDKLLDHGMGRLQKAIFGSKIGRKIAMGIKGFHDDPSSFLGELAEKAGNKGGVVNKALSKIFGEASNIAKVGVNSNNSNLRRLDLNTADTLDVRTKVTINQIIPGYLRKIHAENRAARLGIKDTNIDKLELMFNFATEKFVTKASLEGGLKALIKNRTEKDTRLGREKLRNALNNENVRNVLGKDAFTNEELKAIENAAVIGTSKNYTGGIQFLKSKEFLKALPPEKRKMIENKIKLFSNYLQEHDEEGWKYDDLRYGISSIRSSIPGFYKYIEEEFKNGNVGTLKALGLVKFNRSTGEYELNRKQLENLQFDQFGNHSDIDNIQDQHLISGRDAVRATINKTKEGVSKASAKAKEAYDSIIPDSLKDDIKFAKGKGFDIFNKFKDSGINKFNSVKKSISSRFDSGVLNYFKSGGFMKDLDRFIVYLKETLIPKFKTAFKNFGQLVLSLMPAWIKTKYNSFLSSAKVKGADIGVKLMDRLEPDEQAYILEAIASVKKFKLNNLDKTCINVVKKAKNYIETFDGDAAYLKAKSKIFNTGKSVLDVINGEVSSIKEMRDNGVSVKDILRHKANDAKSYSKSLINYSKNKLNPLTSKAKKLASIGYHLSLSKDQREKLERRLDKYILKHWKKFKSKILSKVPGKVKEAINKAKSAIVGLEIFQKWRNKLSEEDRAKVNAELSKDLDAKTSETIENDNENILDTQVANNTTKLDREDLKEITPEESLKDVAASAEDVNYALKAIAQAASTGDINVVEETLNELKEKRPGVFKKRSVAKASKKALEYCGMQEKAAKELLKELKNSKDDEEKAGIMGRILQKTWGVLPLSGSLKLGFNIAGFVGKSIWTMEKFMWKHVYSKLFVTPFKIAYKIAKKTLIDPMIKIGKMIGRASGLNKIGNWIKSLFKNKFFQNIASGAKSLALGIGGIFGKRKKMVNGKLVDEDDNGEKKEDTVGFFKKLGNKLLAVLTPLGLLFKGLFTKGKLLTTFGKNIGKAIYTSLRHTLPGLLGAAFGGVSKLLKSSIVGGFSIVAKGLSSLLGIGGGVVGGIKSLGSGAMDLLKGGVSSLIEKGGNLISSGVNTIKSIGGKLGEWIFKGFDKAKNICGNITKALYSKIANSIAWFKDVFPSKLMTKLSGKMSRTAISTTIGKVTSTILSRLVPVGALLLAYDIGSIAVLVGQGTEIKSAISMHYLGMDIFSDSDDGSIIEEGSSNSIVDGLSKTESNVDKSINSYNYGEGVLANKGYTKLNVDPLSYSPEKGDVAVTKPYGDSNRSHVAIFDGKTWNSDGKQNTLKGFNNLPDSKAKDYITIWRDNKTNKIPTLSKNTTETTKQQPIQVTANVVSNNSDLIEHSIKQFEKTTEHNNKLISGQETNNATLDNIKTLIQEQNKILGDLVAFLSKQEQSRVIPSYSPDPVYNVNK